jgi:hypothetical protein
MMRPSFRPKASTLLGRRFADGLHGGRILVAGSPREILASSDHERLRGFLHRIELKHSDSKHE